MLFVIWFQVVSPTLAHILRRLNPSNPVKVKEDAATFSIVIWFALVMLFTWLESKTILLGTLSIIVIGLLIFIVAKLRGQDIMNIITSILVLGFGLIGFWYLPPYQATLWLLFVLAAYPPALAITRSQDAWKAKDVIEIYKLGISQIPFIGRFLSSIFNRPPLPPPDPPVDVSGGGRGNTHPDA